MKLGVLFTGGKDSTYATYLMQKQGQELVCLITIKSKNLASYMFHTPAIEVTKLQAEAIGLPLVFKRTKGEKENELVDLERALREAKEKYRLEGIITGAVFSVYQSSRIKKIADKLGLRVFSPLWHKDPESEMKELLEKRFKFIFTTVAAEGLDSSWLNRRITSKDLEKLKQLNQKYHSSILGEGGEFESLVLDCPLFKKELVLEEVEIKKEDKHTARLVVRKATLREKSRKSVP